MEMRIRGRRQDNGEIVSSKANNYGADLSTLVKLIEDGAI